MNRIASTFADLRARDQTALGLFLTNGFPDPKSTLPILRACDEAGADFLELGMPFSDPLAEGLPIQKSSERALKHGVTMDDAFATAAAFREQSETPLLLMGYINPVLRYGVSNFFERAASSGVDGLILPDMPPEEGHLAERAAAEAGVGLVYLIAPNSSEDRVRLVDSKATAFVYAVSVTGLTGSSLGGGDAVAEYLQRARALVTSRPLCVGFGIRNHDDLVRYGAHTDGVIVGSALIQECERLWDDASLGEAERLDGVRRFVRALKYGAH